MFKMNIDINDEALSEIIEQKLRNDKEFLEFLIKNDEYWLEGGEKEKERDIKVLEAINVLLDLYYKNTDDGDWFDGVEEFEED